jgi:hypothetical protein
MAVVAGQNTRNFPIHRQPDARAASPNNAREPRHGGLIDPH